jgi:hypothetical protein
MDARRSPSLNPKAQDARRAARAYRARKKANLPAVIPAYARRRNHPGLWKSYAGMSSAWRRSREARTRAKTSATKPAATAFCTILNKQRLVMALTDRETAASIATKGEALIARSAGSSKFCALKSKSRLGRFVPGGVFDVRLSP